jgi:hypothetical protein
LVIPFLLLPLIRLFVTHSFDRITLRSTRISSGWLL